MIMRKTDDDTTNILYQNEQMKAFMLQAEELVWDDKTSKYVLRQSANNNSPAVRQRSIRIDEEAGFESQRAMINHINQLVGETAENQNKLTLKHIITSYTKSFDRIHIHQGTTHGSSDGQDQVFEFKQKEVMFDQQLCTLIIITDISNLVKVEYARSVEKLSEILIASTSHDMRTPLNTIVNMLKMIKTRINDSELLHWLSVAINSSFLLQFLVNDTLDYFQIKSGKFKQRKMHFKLHDLVKECFDLVDIQMTKKGLKKIIELDQSIQSCEVIGDKDRLSQVLVNLLSNALKFTFTGFIKIKIQNISSDSPDKCSLQFSVEDSGIGIKEEDEEKLFKIFGQVEQHEDINPKGIGLGLTICNNILGQLGTQLKFKGKHAIGTIFYFSIEMPIANDRNQSFQEEEKEPWTVDVSQISMKSREIKTFYERKTPID